MSKTQESTNFQKTLELLNPNQRKAVDAIEGPVLVIAGPGTGKTQILSARIANLLQSDAQVQPDNVLCLTFTNAGRTAMRQRLIQLTDTPTANAVHIHTFHSFCNEIIQSYPETFDYDLKLIDELEQLELLKKVQDTIPQNSPIFKRRFREFQLPKLKKVFEFIKKENINTEDIIEALKQYADGLESDENFIYKRNSGENKKGDLKVDKIKDERKRVEKAIARIELFPLYQELMKEEGYYDYSDMIRWVIQALEQRSDLRYDLQEKYQYTLIDEFQDTNGAQFRLVELLTEYEHHDAPNVFVVGDDDQSIYRFQGANMKNLLDFRNKFEDNIEEIVLDQNYRSSQALLDGAQHVIEQNKDRLISVIPGLQKDLKASNEKIAQLGIEPQILQMVNATQEYMHIARDIQKKIKDGVEPSDIAVLYIQHKYGNDFVKYLSALGVPFFMHKDLDFLQDPLTQMLINLLTYLDTESRDFDQYPNLLFEIMGFPFWEQSSDAGFMILDLYRRRDDKKQSFRSYVHSWVTENRDRSNLKDWESSVVYIYDVLDQLIRDARQQSLPVLINRIITQTGLHHYILERPNKFWNLEILKTLVEKADEVYEKSSGDALQRLLEDLTLMRSSGIALPVTKLLGTKTGVNLMSLHGSKGLEYEHVYIIAANEKNWDDSRNRGNDLTVPSEFFKRIITNTDSDTDPEEKRRLFYVGLTRAKQTLTISLATTDSQGKVTAPVEYVSELIEGYDDLSPKDVEVSPEEIQELEWNALTQDHDLLLEPSEREILEERMQDFTMSVTGLYNYIDCPVKFYYNNLLRVPSGRSLALDFGTMMHNTLERYYKQAKKQGEHLGEDKLLEIYDIEVARNDEKFLDDEAKTNIELGRKDLAQFYKQEILGTSLNVDLEEKLMHTFDHGLKITGVIDKIEVDDNHIKIVDYKTGTPDKDKVKGPNLSARGAGKINNYWLQGFFYKLLTEKSSKYAGKHVSTVRFDFLTPTEEGSFLEAPIDVDQEQYDYTMQKVYESWEKIKNLEFNEGCGDEKCYWCQYRKSLKSV